MDAIEFYYHSKKDLNKNDAIAQELFLLKQELMILDNNIGRKTNNPKAVQNQILDFLNKDGKGVLVAKIENVHKSEDDYFFIYSNQISLMGELNDLLEVIYSFERSFPFARIASIRFDVKRDPRTSKKELFKDLMSNEVNGENFFSGKLSLEDFQQLIS